MNPSPVRATEPVICRLGGNRIDDEQQSWDDYVAGHPDGSFFHRAAWSALISTHLGHRGHYLYALQDGRIVGLLPLVEIRTLLFGSVLASTGFTVGGGPIADNPQVATMLLDEAERIQHRYALDRIEIRGPIAERPGWQRQSGLYASFVRDLDPDIDANLARIRRKQRAMVRKAVARGLTVSIEQDAERFIPLYADSLHRHGTPMLNPSFYQGLLDAFGPDCDVLIIEWDNMPVAGVLNFYHKGTVMPYYAGSMLAARGVAAHDLMYFELMRHGIERKSADRFDFGRSKVGTGSFDFKRHWGFEPTPLDYSFRLPEGDAIPEINPLNPKFQRKIDFWRRLPAPVVARLGPWIARQLG